MQEQRLRRRRDIASKLHEHDQRVRQVGATLVVVGQQGCQCLPQSDIYGGVPPKLRQGVL